MKQKAPSVSIIIPAYNEEDRIVECLQAVMNQTVHPLEVLVIDNNSTDQTAAIARRFKGVKVVRELKQGRAPARNKGLNTAKGDILARIDADTIIPNTWVADVRQLFIEDPQLGGVSGYGRNRVGITLPIFSDIWSWAYFTHCKAFFGATILWGANMAMRSSEWDKAKDLCIDDINAHEDQDISLALHSVGAKLTVRRDINVSVDGGDLLYFDKFWRYNKEKHHSRKIHRLHHRSSLPTHTYIPYYQRLGFHVISTYTVGFFMVFTMLNSMRRSFMNSSGVMYLAEGIKNR